MRAERCNPKKISRLPLKASEAAFSLFFRFFTESWGANKGLGEAPKSYTRKEYESATNPIAKRGQGAIAPCRVKGQRPLWGLGQRPNCSAGDQHRKRTQQRCRQRSVPASNFARPQTRPQAALPPRFREEPFFRFPFPLNVANSAHRALFRQKLVFTNFST